ncbi:hypothetical protein [Staphylococcus lugdunensis]|nr:hypothetical protein [Staphylococcus lugdunensis]
MVKIKREVEMTLPQLIEWGWDNSVRDKSFAMIVVVVFILG